MLCVRCRSWLQKNRRMRAASIALDEVAEVEVQLVSFQTICHTLQQVGLHGHQPRRKPILKLAHKKACKQFAEGNLIMSMIYRNHVLWSDESKVNLWNFNEGNIDSNMYCDILKHKMIPSLQKLFYNITTPNTPPRWQLPCCWRWRWWSGQVCLQTWTLLSTCGASSSGRWRSSMYLTSSSSVMSLWRSGRGCQQQPVQLWLIPCPGGLRQC